MFVVVFIFARFVVVVVVFVVVVMVLVLGSMVIYLPGRCRVSTVASTNPTCANERRC